MENLLVNLQKLSNTFLGVHFLKNLTKTKAKVFKSIFCAVFMFLLVFLALYDAFFDLTVKINEKLQLIFIMLAAGGFLIMFVSFWCNERQFQLLTNWIKTRYTKRSFELINDISKVAYEALSTRMWKIGKQVPF